MTIRSPNSLAASIQNAPALAAKWPTSSRIFPLPALMTVRPPLRLLPWHQPVRFPMQILPCKLTEDHNHGECPYAHPVEKARRRDVRAIAYIDAACPDFRKARQILILLKRATARCPFGERSLHLVVPKDGAVSLCTCICPVQHALELIPACRVNT